MIHRHRAQVNPVINRYKQRLVNMQPISYQQATRGLPLSRFLPMAMMITIAFLLAGCSLLNGKKGQTTVEYDLGSLAAAESGVANDWSANAGNYSVPEGITLAEIAAPAALQNNKIQYRRLHKDAYARNAYAYSKWSANLPSLLQQQLYTRLNQQIISGVNKPSSASPSRYILQITLSEFIHEFSSEFDSTGAVILQAQLYDQYRNKMVSNRVFTQRQPVASADPAAGVAALAEATQIIIQELQIWLRGSLSR